MAYRLGGGLAGGWPIDWGGGGLAGGAYRLGGGGWPGIGRFIGRAWSGLSGGDGSAGDVWGGPGLEPCPTNTIYLYC